MIENINFGIDLGTTNSGIGKYENGKVQVLKNPVGLSEILPSVVSFYRGRTLVGSKAREQYLSNAGNVFSVFKRKMGTGETYRAKQQDQLTRVSPVDLSAYVLKELKNYVQGSDVEAAVITIPASFDTIQSNATKSAGYQAGFKEVVLLQEPIAACLAYSNLSMLNVDKEQKWLVYDFGGGTFDVALVYINHRELKVIDNKGNNFLGGVDIDHAFMAQIIVPKLSAHINDPDLWAKLTRKDALYEKLWYYLNYLAEEAKKELSVSATAWMEIDFPELDIFLELTITQQELNRVVEPKYQESEQFISELLAANNLSFKDIERIILVGGTTYIPLIRESLKAVSGVIVDSSIDPTTAIIVGAAYYAGAHSRSNPVNDGKKADLPNAIDVKLSFEPYSNDLEELIAFKTASPFTGFYRITRTDGGFDTGLRAFNQTASEFVTLLPKTANVFKISISDEQHHVVYESDAIAISHGLYGVSGQLLPEDICIELDDRENNTYLDVIFKRNSILPLSKTIYKTFSKSIIKDSDDKVTINVVEGKSGTMPGSNLSIGYIEIAGKKISSDLIQGTDIEIQVDMDESRGLKVDVYIPSTGQQLSQNFHIAKREISIKKMLQDIGIAEALLWREITNSNKVEAYELSAKFQQIEKELFALKVLLQNIIDDQVTEEKYRLDIQKRKLLGELDSLTRSRDVYIAITKYNTEKAIYRDQEEYANESQKFAAEKILAQEKELLHSADKHLIAAATDQLKELNNRLTLQNIEKLINIFWSLAAIPEQMFNNMANRQELITAGQQAITARDVLQLRQIVSVLYANLDNAYKISIAAKEDIKTPIDKDPFKTGLK